MAVTLPPKAQTSERDRVLDYLWTHTNEAFRDGKLVEAHDYHRLYDIIEALGDDEYAERYCI